MTPRVGTRKAPRHSLAEDVTQARERIVEAARLLVAYPNDGVFRASLKARVSDLDTAMAVLVQSRRPKRQVFVKKRPPFDRAAFLDSLLPAVRASIERPMTGTPHGFTDRPIAAPTTPRRRTSDRTA